MRKTLLIAAAALAITAMPVAQASSAHDSDEGKGYVRYIYRANSASASTGTAGYDLRSPVTKELAVGYGVGKRLTVAGERTDGTQSFSGGRLDATFTDLSVQYKVTEGAALWLGNRHSTLTATDTGGLSVSGTENRIFSGLLLNHKVDRSDLYLSYRKANNFDEWVVGGKYQVGPDVFVNVNYKKYKYEQAANTVDMKGLGAGLEVRF